MWGEREFIVYPDLKAFAVGDLATALGVTDVEVTGLPDWEKKHEGLCNGYTSDAAPRMSVDEIKEALTHV